MSIVLLLLCAVSFSYLQNLDYKELLKKQLSSSINGSVDFADYSFEYKNKTLALLINDLKFMDEKHQVLFDFKDLLVSIQAQNLLNPLERPLYVKSSSLEINAVRSQDAIWNFQNLRKKSRNLLAIKIENLELPNIQLHIKDEITNKQIDHDHVKIDFVRLKSSKSKYQILLESQSLTESNNIKVSGLYDTRKNDDITILEKIKDLNFDIQALDFLNLSFIANIFSIYSDYDFNTLLNETFTDDLKFSFNSLVDHSEQNLNLDLILSWSKSLIEIKGQLIDWLAIEPKANLEVLFQNINLFELKENSSMISPYVPSFVLELLQKIHYHKVLTGIVSISERIDAPKVRAEFGIFNPYVVYAKKQIPRVKANFAYGKDKVILESFELPVDFSTVKISGELNRNDDSYNVDLIANDLALDKIKPLIEQLPVLGVYKKAFEDSSIKGFASLGLNISKKPKAKNKEQKTNINGDLKLEKLNFISKDYPLVFADLAADLKVNNELVSINNIQSYIDGDYIEARGNINLNSSSGLNLEIASPKISAATLVKSKILSLVNSSELQLKSASGDIKDAYLLVNKKKNDFKINGRLDFEGVNLVFSNDQQLQNIQGTVNLKDKKFNFNDFALSLDDKSLLSINGTINQDYTKPSLKISADNIAIAQALKFFDPKSRYGIDVKDGTLDADLQLENGSITGSGIINRADFLYKNSKYAKYPVIDLNGTILLDKNLTIANASGYYGSSSFSNLLLDLKNYKSPSDFSIDLSSDFNLLVDEVYSLIPANIRKFLVIKGTIPATINISGNTKKLDFDIVSELSSLPVLKFANWFEKKPGYKFDLKSKFFVTPQQIFSEKSHLYISKAEKTSKVKVDFHASDYKDKEKASYYVGFKTNQKLDTELGLIENHIISLETLNLTDGLGKFSCDTFGSNDDRQTICDFNVKSTTAEKYGIGDLYGRDIYVDLISLSYKPLDVNVAIANGDWHGIPYKDANFHIKANGDMLYISGLKTRSRTGFAEGEIDFNTKTLDSSFTISGHNLPANDLAEGIWNLGSEVPEGSVSGIFKGQTTGVLPEPMFENLVGSVSAIVKKGKLSTLSTMQKLLTAANTLKSFSINNVFQTLVTYKGGLFDHAISSLQYDRGKVSTEKFLLKAEQIELNASGYVDFVEDSLALKGEGLIPKSSKSFLQKVGIGDANLGNLLSVADLSLAKSKDKRFFDFAMSGPVTDPDAVVESLRENFTWR